MLDVLERGDIAFFYRPRVQAAGAVVHAPGVQAFFLILAPADGKARRLRIGRKRLPTRPGERYWAEVERVGSFARVLGDQLEEEHYTTKTRGERVQPGARPIAHGVYAFARHDDHVHLIFRVEHVEGEAPEEVSVPEEIDRDGAEIVLVGTTPADEVFREVDLAR